MYFGRSNNASRSNAACAERRDGIKDLSQRRVLSTHRLESDALDVSVDEESCDVLWSTAVRCNRFVRDADRGYLASVMRQHGLLAYDGSVEAGNGSLHYTLKADTTPRVLVEARNTSYGRAFFESSILLCKPEGANRTTWLRYGAHLNGWVHDRCGAGPLSSEAQSFGLSAPPFAGCSGCFVEAP